MSDYLKINRESVSFTLNPQQQAAVLTVFEPLFESLVDRMAVKAKQLCDDARPRYYSRVELAELLHVSLPSLHNYVKDGKLNPLKVNGKTLFDAREVDKLIEAGNLRKYQRS